MDKNTIWAIVLSTLVIIGSYLILPKFFPGLNMMGFGKQANAQTTTEETAEPQEFSLDDSAEVSELSIAADYDEESEDQPALVEQKYTITTDKVEAVFTNKGGDIISYKLLDHKDMDTNDFVQLSDNVNSKNRTCAISFGKAEEKIIDEIFNTETDGKTITFTKTMNVNGKKTTMRKVYSFMDGEYVFKLDVLIHTADSNGLDLGGTSYTIRTSPQIGPHFNPKQNRYERREFITFNGNKYKKIMLSNGQFKEYDKDLIWAGIAGKYFVELMIPSAPEKINTSKYSSQVEVNNYANAQAFIERAAFSGSDISDTYYMYFGPRNDKDLKRYNIAENNGWNLGGKKVTQALQTSGWLNWLEKILKVVLEMLNKLFHNWGVSIIIMTLILKVIMFPLSKKQSLGSLKMQELQPKMQALQEKYKGDQQKLQQETSKLYQQAGYNPASGCLPMLFQFLILFAMYNLFNNYFEFRGAMFIPHWIPDLSTGDVVKTFNFNIPLLGNQLRLLPVIYVGTQLLSGKITQYGQTTAPGQSQATMKFMMYGMPLMFFFMFYNAPSGLLLYWLTSNVLQIFQQLIINKMMKEKRAEKEAGKPAAKVQKTLPPKAKRK
ncbi:YidC/Oxa1 family membrane protein insertase [Treponema bryantii]|uniref:Membrane protein insertase YidC n=1 Tax=Treponema bryantii TaxID=163 RepID=A0A1I3HY94_9SPIR|nr:membrane protein insertase YidC [Treponema bryantii]SFI40715.1 YidC/Oxa1 family membrane protein insertase [Treponema bryantii]